MKLRSGLLPRVQILVVAALFSTGGAAIKAVSFSAWQVVCLRSGIAALTLWFLLPEARCRWTPRMILVGATHGLTMIFFVLANKLTTAAATIFLQSTAPLYVLLLAPWLLKEKVGRREVLYLLSLAAGMALFFVGLDPAQKTAPDPARGNLIAALSGLTWALTMIGLRGLESPAEGGGDGGSGGSAAGAVVIANLLAAGVALPMAWPLAGGDAADWGTIAYLGVIQIGVAYALLTRAVRHLGAVELSLLLLLEPVLNPIFAWLVHGETPGPWSLAGGAVILGATALKTWLDARRTAAISRRINSKAGPEPPA